MAFSINIPTDEGGILQGCAQQHMLVIAAEGENTFQSMIIHTLY